MPRTRKKHTQTILTVTGMQMQNKANYLHISLSGEQPGWLHHLVKKLTLVMLLTEEIDTQRLSWHTTTLDCASNNSEDCSCHYLNYLLLTPCSHALLQC